MNNKSSTFDTNVLLTKYSSSVRLIICFIILWLTVNTIGTFAIGEPNGNLLYDEKTRRDEVRWCDDDSITISIAFPKGFLGKKLDEVELPFHYIQTLKMILSNIDHDEEDVVEILREHYANNRTMLKIINEFEQDYTQHTPIWLYTRECLLSSIINQAFQTMNMKILVKMSFFLRAVYQQIEKFHAQKSKSLDSFIVYRCLQLSTSDFNKLQQYKGAFMSFNTFLFTSIDRDLTVEVCSTSPQNVQMLPVVFEIKIEDTASNFTPFVRLDHLSYHSQSKKNILFSMNSIFRIINTVKNERNMWQVQLVGANCNDSSLASLLLSMHLRTFETEGWDILGHSMISMNELRGAEELYLTLLESIEASDEKERILLYEKLGIIKYKNGSYEEASLFFEKTLQIQQKFLESKHLDLASTYSWIGIANSKIGKLEKALSCHEKALEIQEINLPSNHPVLGITYDNIASVAGKMGKHLIALSFHHKALEINEAVLSFYHPDLAINYNNIGGIYAFLGDYATALSFYQKAVQINENILSPDDPDLAIGYDNIGGVYLGMKQFENALLFCEKALQIYEKVLHFNHPELAYNYNNIGNIKLQIGDYEDAILFQGKALEIQKVSLPLHHPSIASTYIYIGDVCRITKEFAITLSFYQMALEIQEISLPNDHSDFVRTYMKLGQVHYMDGKYSTALSYFERALEIGEVSLPESHPWMEILRHDITLVEKEL